MLFWIKLPGNWYHMLTHAQQIASEIISPPLRVRKFASHGISSESYHAQYQLGRVEASSATELGCLYAATQLATAARANHMGEHLGVQTPRFPLRPIWFRELTAQSIGSACIFAASCGYNALLTEFAPTEKQPLQIIQKVSDISQASPYSNYLFLELTPTSKVFLELEIAEKQIRQWEEQIPSHGLIVYLKCDTQEGARRQAEWLPELCDHCGDQTILAFSALAGEATSLDATLHPLWSSLRKIPLASSTPLMPIVNAGCIHLGEGLWPISLASELDEILSLMSHHTFAGILSLAGSIPPPQGGLAACNLWIAGQAQWQGRAAVKLVDTWLRAYRPDLDRHLLRNVSLEAHQIIRKLAFLRVGNIPGEEARALSDLIVSRLSYLTRQWGTQSDYIRYFCCDAWCLLVDALNILRLPLTPILMHADLRGGFWTETGPANRVLIRSSPQPRLDDPNMIRLFHENR